MADSTAGVKMVPEIDEEALLAAVLKVIEGHAVVRPGETLIIRCGNWTPQQVDQYQEYLDHQDLPFRALVVLGDELAVAELEPQVRLEVTGSGEWPATATVMRPLQGHVPGGGLAGSV